MNSNGTLLGVVPMRTGLLVTAAVLVALFTIVEPEASAGLSLLPRFCFWLLHICIGVLAIVLASKAVHLFTSRRFPVFAVVTVTGIFGAVIATPIFLLIEQFFPAEPPDSWLDTLAKTWWQSMLVELLEAMPTLLICWYAVNLPLLFNNVQVNDDGPGDDDPKSPSEADIQEQKRQQTLEELYDRLPKVIGRDIVAISSDLHYLNVHTTLGKALILGSLKTCAEAFDEAGMLVHRSHWVAKSHVARVHVSTEAAYCVMSTGLKVPISRSKRKEVKQYFGQSTVTPARESRVVKIK